MSAVQEALSDLYKFGRASLWRGLKEYNCKRGGKLTLNAVNYLYLASKPICPYIFYSKNEIDIF